MITVTNGKMTLTIPNSAYRLIYAAAGFQPVDGEKPSESENTTFPTREENGPEIAISLEENEENSELAEAEEPENKIDLSEIPLGEMTFSQLAEYAEELGLDYTGIRSKKELRALIRNNI